MKLLKIIDPTTMFNTEFTLVRSNITNVILTWCSGVTKVLRKIYRKGHKFVSCAICKLAFYNVYLSA